MCESVKDRPTSSYEYVFLLSQNESYFYDLDAIREPPTGRTGPITFGHVPDRRDVDRIYAKSGEVGANARNVWVIPPQPYKGHFGVMPVELASRCIKAGSRAGDMVLDPFAGVATTGVACQNLGRNSVLIELNPEYVAIGQNRLRDNSLAQQRVADLSRDEAA